MEGEIIFNIDVMLAKRKMSVTELADKVGITLANVSVLKNGKARALKMTTLAKLCEALDCQPGDLLTYSPQGGQPLATVGRQGRRQQEEARTAGGVKFEELIDIAPVRRL